MPSRALQVLSPKRLQQPFHFCGARIFSGTALSRGSSLPFLHLPAGICLRTPDLPHPSPLYEPRPERFTSPCEVFRAIHVSQSPVSTRKHSISLSRKSLLRSIYLSFLLHRPQMTPFCFMVACDVHSCQSQQMRVKPNAREYISLSDGTHRAFSRPYA